MNGTVPPVRAVFFGSADIGLPALEVLRQSTELVAVVTQPDRPSGRGLRSIPGPMKQFAERFGLPVFQPDRLRTEETIEFLRALGAGVFVVMAYGKIFPPELLEMPPHGCINLHASLLPRHRGASPVTSAILAGDKVSGVSVMRMDEGMDTGPVYFRKEVPLSERETGGSLYKKLQVAAGVSLEESLPRILSGDLLPEPQVHAEATCSGKIRKQDGLLDWQQSASELERKIRAFDPWPGTFCFLPDHNPLRVCAAEMGPEEIPHGVAPGTILSTKKRLEVATGKGALFLTEVQPAGKRRMSAEAFLAGHGVSAGQSMTLSIEQ